MNKFLAVIISTIFLCPILSYSKELGGVYRFKVNPFGVDKEALKTSLTERTKRTIVRVDSRYSVEKQVVDGNDCKLLPENFSGTEDYQFSKIDNSCATNQEEVGAEYIETTTRRAFSDTGIIFPIKIDIKFSDAETTVTCSAFHVFQEVMVEYHVFHSSYIGIDSTTCNGNLFISTEVERRAMVTPGIFSQSTNILYVSIDYLSDRRYLNPWKFRF